MENGRLRIDLRWRIKLVCISSKACLQGLSSPISHWEVAEGGTSWEVEGVYEIIFTESGRHDWGQWYVDETQRRVHGRSYVESASDGRTKGTHKLSSWTLILIAVGVSTHFFKHAATVVPTVSCPNSSFKKYSFLSVADKSALQITCPAVQKMAVTPSNWRG